MIITNGKIIVSPDNNIETLEGVAEQLKENAKDVLAINLDLEVKEDSEERSYPYIEIVSTIEYKNLKKCLTPDMDLHFRAIGKEKVQMPEKYVKDFKYNFTEEELQEIARNLGEQLSEKERIEAAKKAAMSDFKKQLDKIESAISLNGKKIRERGEVRTHNALLHLDFETDVRIFTDEKTNEILHTEPLLAADHAKIIYPETEDGYETKVEEGKDPFAEDITEPEEVEFEETKEGNEPEETN